MYRFFQDFLADLYNHPQAYALPGDPYIVFTEDRFRTQVDKKKEEPARAARVKARKAIEYGLVDFLYQLGQLGEVHDQFLQVTRPVFDQILDEKVKKTRNKALLRGFERMGFAFVLEKDEVVIHQDRYPGMLPILFPFCENVCGDKRLWLLLFPTLRSGHNCRKTPA